MLWLVKKKIDSVGIKHTTQLNHSLHSICDTFTKIIKSWLSIALHFQRRKCRSFWLPSRKLHSAGGCSRITARPGSHYPLSRHLFKFPPFFHIGPFAYLSFTHFKQFKHRTGVLKNSNRGSLLFQLISSLCMSSEHRYIFKLFLCNSKSNMFIYQIEKREHNCLIINRDIAICVSFLVVKYINIIQKVGIRFPPIRIRVHIKMIRIHNTACRSITSS